MDPDRQRVGQLELSGPLNRPFRSPSDSLAASPLTGREAGTRTPDGDPSPSAPAGPGSSTRVGNVMVTDVPSPTTEVREMFPWSWVTSSRQIARPRPLPSTPECSSRASRKKGSKTISTASGGMPGPESETVTDQESASALPETRTWPPIGVYFNALETRLPRICWQREASVTTRLSGGSIRDSQRTCRAAAVGRELAGDLVDQGADGERAEAERPGALDDPGVIEVAARELEHVIAERDHREEVAALVGRERRGRLAEEQVESGLQGSEGAAEFMAEAGEGPAQLPPVDRGVIARPALRRGG